MCKLRMYQNVLKNLYMYNIVMYRPIARQRLGKHVSTGTNAHNNRMSIARQQISKHI
jgi:hypothetical protein